MKKIIVTSVCTLTLSLLGAFGSYQNSSANVNEYKAFNNTTSVEQNVTKNEEVKFLNNSDTTTATKETISPSNITTADNSSDIKTEVKGAVAYASNKGTCAAKTCNTSKGAKNCTKTKCMVYKNVDLSNCKSTKSVVNKLRKNGLKNITLKNVDDIKALDNILDCIKDNECTNSSCSKADSVKKIVTKQTDKATTTKKVTNNTTPKVTKTSKPATNTTTTTNKTVKPATSTTVTKKPTTTSANTNMSSYASEVLKLVNQERAKAGLSALTTTSELTSAANKRAQETVQSFSHTRPNGSSFSTVLKEFNVTYRAAGENIAYGQKTPQEVVTAWMNSPGHRANIMKADFGKIGIGVHKGSNGTIYWSQLFTN
jgi:uncharacterized protein YkwD